MHDRVEAVARGGIVELADISELGERAPDLPAVGQIDAQIVDARLAEGLQVGVDDAVAEIAARGYGDYTPDSPTNIKSASKSIMSALAGIAVDKGYLQGPNQPIAPLLESDLPAGPDPRLSRVTLGNLLSMQAGLERQSGANYGRWVSSGNWVRSAHA